MKIIHIAPPFLALKEGMEYGGTERDILALNKKQREQGLETRIIATSDSTLNRTDTLLPTVDSIGVADIYDQNLTSSAHRSNTYAKLEHCAAVMRYVSNEPEAFLHVHDDYLLPFLNLLPNPSLLNIHGDYETFWQPEKHPLLMRGYSPLIAISHSHKKIFESHGFSIKGVVYNGIPIESFPFRDRKREYLLTLSAIAPHKGQKTAVSVAQALGRDLIIAGNVVDQAYFCSFKDAIAHDLSSHSHKLSAYLELPANPKIVYVGSVNDEQKKPLFSHAKAFLMPIEWEEPLGLVMIEALACGTPVIAFNRGAVPEIVVDGKTGYIVETAAEMIEAVKKIDRINPHDCRKYAEQNFSMDLMAQRYSALYQEISAAKK